MKWVVFVCYIFSSCHYASKQLEIENKKEFLNQLKLDSLHTMHKLQTIRSGLLLTWEKWQNGYDSAYRNKFYDSIFLANDVEPEKGDVIYSLKQLDSIETKKHLDSLKRQIQLTSQ